MSSDEEEEAEVEEVKEVEKYLYYTTEQQILPNNERTAEMQQRRLAETRKKKMQEEEDEKLKQENIKKKREEDEQNKKIKAAMELKRQQDELRQQKELEQLADLKGKFGELIADLKHSTTRLELTLTGEDFTPVQCRIIFKCIQQNQSVKTLSINRKQLGDEEGIELAKNLVYNDYLERLDLENNNIGPKFLESLALTVAKNVTLRTIDLEGNNLTNGNDENGILCLIESLRNNDDLLSLNLNNCNLTKQVGKKLKEVLRENKKLINIDVERNPSLEIEDVREIQSYLERNHNEYLAERKREWQERKFIKNEKDNIAKILAYREAEMANIKHIKEDAERKQLTREEIFLKDAEEEEEYRRREEKKLEKEQAARAGKKKKKGGMK